MVHWIFIFAGKNYYKRRKQMQTKKIKLSRVDWAKAAAIAYDRAANKEPWQEKIQSSKAGLLHISIIGSLGEIVFSRLTGLPVDEAVYERGDRYDFLAGDMRVAVKTREWSGGNLEMHLFPDEPKRADLFVLFRIANRCDEIEMFGHVTSEHILEHFKPEYHKHLYGRKVMVPAFAFSRPYETIELIRLKADQTSHKQGLTS